MNATLEIPDDLLRRVKSRCALARVFLVALIGLTCVRAAAQTVVASLPELAAAAVRDGQRVVMKPGLYRMADVLSRAAIQEKRKREDWALLTFSGSGNTFDFTGVEIEVDTALVSALNTPVHADEFLMTGHSNVVKGLVIRCLEGGGPNGGALWAMRGRGNTLSNCTFHVRGSSPYGYGDLFGKGSDPVIGHRKHCGVRVTGDGTRLLRCTLHMRAFGHGFFIQEDAADVRLEDCRVEGETRATADMLTETSGPAFNAGFRTVAPNRQGEHRVTAGYRKSLCEDGFRTYGSHRNLVFLRCSAHGMRGGFELRTRTGVRLEDCRAEGNERGFWVADDAVLTRCVGDATLGPLLFVEGARARVDLTLTQGQPLGTVHALASIAGDDHQIHIRAGPGAPAAHPAPILVGYGVPMMGEGMAPIPEARSRRLNLVNETVHPIEVSTRAEDCRLRTKGSVSRDQGRRTGIERGS